MDKLNMATSPCPCVCVDKLNMATSPCLCVCVCVYVGARMCMQKLRWAEKLGCARQPKRLSGHLVRLIQLPSGGENSIPQLAKARCTEAELFPCDPS